MIPRRMDSDELVGTTKKNSVGRKVDDWIDHLIV